MNPITRFRDRLRVARLHQQLSKLLAEDRQARLGATTRSLMDDMVVRAGQIARLRLDIAEIEGIPTDSGGMDSGGFDDRLPSGVFVPTEGKQR